MGYVIAMANQKGGVAKTTSVVNLADALGRMNKSVLVVDLDPQGNATSGYGINRRKLKHCIYDVLVGGVPAESVLVKTKFSGVRVLPATINLAGAEIELVSMVARENKLRQAIQHLRERYDYIIIDCPPSLGLLTLNGLTAADSIVIPVQCEYYALEGIADLTTTIKMINSRINPKLEIQGIVLTMYDSRTNFSEQVAGEIRRYFGNKVYKTIIPRNIRIAEAPSHGKPVIAYDRISKGSSAYLKLATELVKQIEGV